MIHQCTRSRRKFAASSRAKKYQNLTAVGIASNDLAPEFTTPTLQDHLTLAFDEIRQFGAGSVQVMRRLRAALDGLFGWLPTEDRRQVVRRYLARLDRAVEASDFDFEDRGMALADDRQGIGLSRPKAQLN